MSRHTVGVEPFPCPSNQRLIMITHKFQFCNRFFEIFLFFLKKFFCGCVTRTFLRQKDELFAIFSADSGGFYRHLPLFLPTRDNFAFYLSFFSFFLDLPTKAPIAPPATPPITAKIMIYFAAPPLSSSFASAVVLSGAGSLAIVLSLTIWLS